MSNRAHHIPTRDELAPSDRWDLATVFASDDEWESAFAQIKNEIPRAAAFKGTLGRDAASLRACLDFMNGVRRRIDRLAQYASLRVSENVGDSTAQGRYSRVVQIDSEFDAAASYVAPEIQAIPDAQMERYLEGTELADFRVYLRKLLRWKPHILSESEERILALQEEANQTAYRSFSALTNVDMDFGKVTTDAGDVPLSQSSFGSLMQNPDREVRREAYVQFYDHFRAHENTLATLLAGKVNLDVYRAKVRNFPSAREAALFPDRIPTAVYDNLIETVRDNFDALHRYYALRKSALGLAELRHYDVYVPLQSDVRSHHTYDEAVETISDALAPLGTEYVETLRGGLLGGWVDRYETRGKRSGAFSSGSFDTNPFILMNYKEDVLRDVFTLAHEAGHSMHSWYSKQANPYQHYRYTIFEAEVASTFNEALLLHHMLQSDPSDRMRAYLLNKQIDDIVATLFRQTMFAEFERTIHAMVEEGRPLTVETLRAEYRSLLTAYFGPEMVLEQESDLEGLRIPHFYMGFYVYKYATGIASSLSLSQRVLAGEPGALESYFTFLRSGGSRFPIESLRAAGVDMEEKKPVQTALELFSSRVDELSDLLGRLGS
ncbi:MAG: oligoendopeptidase F [Spirochaetota bacterium]